jgi:hypothetical protein
MPVPPCLTASPRSASPKPNPRAESVRGTGNRGRPPVCATASSPLERVSHARFKLAPYGGIVACVPIGRLPNSPAAPEPVARRFEGHSLGLIPALGEADSRMGIERSRCAAGACFAGGASDWKDWVAETASGQELSEDRYQPSAPPHDRGHDGPRPLAGDATILRACGVEVRPVFRPVVRHADAEGRAQLSGPPRLEGCGVGEPEPDGGCASVLPRRHARDGGDPRADRLRPRATSPAGGAERRRGGAVPRGRAQPEARAAPTTAYAAGLRASEVTNLRPTSTAAG